MLDQAANQIYESKNYHRRYSWPPSLHLIDIANIHIPLPDIDDDPFAHFVSSPPVEDDFEQYLDALACTTGIFTPQSTGLASKEKAHKFGTSIAKKWNQFMGRRHSSLGGWDQVQGVDSKVTQALGSSHDTGRRDAKVSGMGTMPRRSGRTPKYASPKLSKRSRHSWHAGAPSIDLNTIEEETESRFDHDPMIETE